MDWLFLTIHCVLLEVDLSWVELSQFESRATFRGPKWLICPKRNQQFSSQSRSSFAPWWQSTFQLYYNSKLQIAESQQWGFYWLFWNEMKHWIVSSFDGRLFVSSSIGFSNILKVWIVGLALWSFIIASSEIPSEQDGWAYPKTDK